MSNPDERQEATIARAWLRNWAIGITTNPPSPEACAAVLAEYDDRVRGLEQLRDRVAGVMNLPSGTTDDQVVAAAFSAYGAAHPEGPGSDVRAELQRVRAELERVNDALAEADQTQLRTDDQIGETRDGVMAAIDAAGLAPHVCDDDDLPDMVRHALTAAKQLAQPALWTYNERGEAENQVVAR